MSFGLAFAHIEWSTHVSPSAGILLLTAGVLLIYLELNRPGWIVPGATGLLLLLLAIAAILKAHPQPLALALLTGGFVLLVLGSMRAAITAFGGLPATAFVMAFLHLGAAPGVSILCGVVLGIGTYWLTRIARRARANKGLDLKRARTSRPGVSKF